MKSLSFQSTSRDSNVQFSASATEVGGLPPSTDEADPSSPIRTSTAEAPAKGRGPAVTRVEKWLLRRLLAAIGNPPVVAVLWTGEEIAPAGQPDPNLTGEPNLNGDPNLNNEMIRFRIGDRATFWRILSDPFFQFPEAYCNGRLEVDGDLETLMSHVAQSAALSPQATRWLTYTTKLLHWGSRNTLAASQKNIQHHYDLGNDFYRLWLDENLLYTCAYFEEPSVSLEQAQCAKMDHVCRKLELRAGETVIEAGCGWGGFALHMAKHYGVRVRAYNISREQVAEARRRAQAEGLADRVEFVLEDWRKITGTCDVFVSIGMLEHVGTANYRQLGDVIDGCLAADGRGLIHTIGRNQRQPLDPWIERRIFPGAYPPSLGQMSAIFERRDFSMLDVENIRLHYAETLRHWLARYEQSVDTVGRLYDERFVRMWRMYLAGSVAAFEWGSLQLFQVLFARPRRNRLPLTRAHQYAHLFEAPPPSANGDGHRPFETVFWGQR
ncbi:MAG TPA: cyclopropane-fatty-acyl-phospholipid synthase family protein [Planctomycetaceae bacterium]|jgi:cyclopropane-fatty-acyl-phospholipid synthase|nr:cyclopropane-fatty-acyl-phospholipid synthase family protein [Planctomycetaceae bacterium]